MSETASRGTVLLAIAREAIAQGEDLPAAFTWDFAWLRECAASFVTLRAAGDLRGCIGCVDAHRPLGDDVARNAHAAAYRDRRFAPVMPAERAALTVEVSVLTPRVRVPAASEEQALAALRPGEDGIYLEYLQMSATFLPQVWQSLPAPVDFLAELRRKAGLPLRFWHADIKLSRYSVEKFE
jgi:hypothetical protein